ELAASLIALDQALFVERGEELDREEGIAGCLVLDQLDERRGVFDGAVEGLADERGESCGREGTEHDVRDTGARLPHLGEAQYERVRGGHLVVAVRADDED